MAIVSLQRVQKSYGGKVVLRDLSLDLHPTEKVGLVGANGCGKTTLFKMLVGLEQPDHGELTTSRGLKIAYLPQEPTLDSQTTLIEAVGEAFAWNRRAEADIAELGRRIAAAHGTPDEAKLLEDYDRLHAAFEAAGGYDFEIRIREVLGGLGFGPEEYDRPVGVLSGGQKCRAALARLLLTPADLLLLDEPTNHLDIAATTWLEEFLGNFPGAAVIISHDRYLLDRVAAKIIEVEGGRATVYPGNYTNYAGAKRIRRLEAMREYEKQSEFLAHQRDYIARTHAAKDSAKQARARRKLLDRMEARGEILDKPDAERPAMKLKFSQNARAGDMVLRCEKAGKQFGDLVLIRDLDFEMTRGEKVGIIGPNGVGKTTLLRMLLGQTPPTAGKVRLFESLTVGYYDQEHRDLDPDLTVIEAVRRERPDMSEAMARSFLALFLFRGDDVFQKVGTLSGGEQSRVLLARLVANSPQVLVLDEPTNHLDIPAREALEEALALFPGSALIVSHDRYFLDKVAQRLLVLVARGQHEFVTGSWSVYAAILAERKQSQRAAELRERDRRRADAAKHAAPSAGAPKKKSRSRYAAQRLQELEARIETVETGLKEMEAGFADPAVLRDAERSRKLHEEYNARKDELAELIAQWEQCVDGMET